MPASQKNFKFPVSRPDDRAIPSGCPSVHCSIHLDDVSYRTAKTDQHHPSRRRDHSVRTLYCIEKGLSSFHPSGRFSSTSRRLSVLDQFSISFQVPRKGRSIIRPDDVVSRPDARLLKARITIQISLSGRLTALVRTRVHQRRKLHIRLQPSGRLLLMVRTHTLQIWKLRVEELPFGSSSPWSGRSKAL
jgi:hypothetical protein